jgi:hypothetical protein
MRVPARHEPAAFASERGFPMRRAGRLLEVAGLAWDLDSDARSWPAPTGSPEVSQRLAWSHFASLMRFNLPFLRLFGGRAIRRASYPPLAYKRYAGHHCVVIPVDAEVEREPCILSGERSICKDD